MKNIDLVIVYNNPPLMEQLEQSVQKTLPEDMAYHLIALDNTGKAYSSAAAAYNHALRGGYCRSEVVIFCHQDIVFLEGCLENIYNTCRRQPRCLYGAAGIVWSGGRINDNITVSSMAQNQEDWRYNTLPEGEERDVHTLDECLVAGSRELFETLSYDEILCDGWHFYTVELSLRCHTMNIPVRALDANMIHLSSGTPDANFYRCEKRIAKKYRKYFPVLRYSSGWCYTNPVKYFLQNLYRKLRYKI